MSRTAEQSRALALEPLSIDPLDTDGRLLRLHCSPTRHLAVATATISVGAASVQLDVLAASHRVRVTPAGHGAERASWRLDETVACGTAADAVVAHELPAEHTWRSGPWHLTFRSSMSTGDASVTDNATRLLSQRDDPDHLVVRFPGHPHALTGLHVAGTEHSLTWHSWHLYPGEDPHAVLTTTHATRQPKGTAA